MKAKAKSRFAHIGEEKCNLLKLSPISIFIPKPKNCNHLRLFYSLNDKNTKDGSRRVHDMKGLCCKTTGTVFEGSNIFLIGFLRFSNSTLELESQFPYNRTKGTLTMCELTMESEIKIARIHFTKTKKFNKTKC